MGFMLVSPLAKQIFARRAFGGLTFSFGFLLILLLVARNQERDEATPRALRYCVGDMPA